MQISALLGKSLHKQLFRLIISNVCFQSGNHPKRGQQIQWQAEAVVSFCFHGTLRLSSAQTSTQNAV